MIVAFKELSKVEVIEKIKKNRLKIEDSRKIIQ